MTHIIPQLSPLLTYLPSPHAPPRRWSKDLWLKSEKALGFVVSLGLSPSAAALHGTGRMNFESKDFEGFRV